MERLRSYKILCYIMLFTFILTIAPINSDDAGAAETAEPVAGAVDIKDLNVATFTLPIHLGNIKDAWDSGNASGKIVIHIQDAHCNYAAQHKIADIVEYLNKEYGISAVNLEGGVRDYDLSVFNEISDKNIRKSTADYLVKDGIVNGAEYFAINNPEQTLLWGVEDGALYMDNLKIYRDSLKYKKETDKDLKELSIVLSSLKTKIYSKELLEFDMNYAAYKADNLDFKDYLAYLINTAKGKGVDIKVFKNLFLLNEAISMERDINFKKVNNERDDLIDKTSKRLSKIKLEEFVAKIVDFKKERVSQNVFYDYLINKAKESDVDIEKFPEFKKYILYISIYNAIDKEKVMKEIGSIEEIIKDRLYRNDIERELGLLSKDFVLLRNIFNISITKDDYEYYLANKDKFNVAEYARFFEKMSLLYDVKIDLNKNISDLDRYRDEIAEFYVYSFKRDEAFIKNMRFADVMANNYSPLRDKQAAIIITGGFHTENMAELFKKEGISYISIMPYFQTPEGYHSPYFDILSGKESGLIASFRSALSLMQVASFYNILGLEANKVDAEIARILPLAIGYAVELKKPFAIQIKGEPYLVITAEGFKRVRDKEDLKYITIVNENNPINKDNVEQVLWGLAKVGHDYIVRQQNKHEYVLNDAAHKDLLQKLDVLINKIKNDDIQGSVQGELNYLLNKQKSPKIVVDLKNTSSISIVDGILANRAGGQGIYIQRSSDDDMAEYLLHELLAGTYGNSEDAHIVIDNLIKAIKAGDDTTALVTTLSSYKYKTPVWKVTDRQERIDMKRDYAVTGVEEESVVTRETLNQFNIRAQDIPYILAIIRYYKLLQESRGRVLPQSLNEIIQIFSLNNAVSANDLLYNKNLDRYYILPIRDADLQAYYELSSEEDLYKKVRQSMVNELKKFNYERNDPIFGKSVLLKESIMKKYFMEESGMVGFRINVETPLITKVRGYKQEDDVIKEFLSKLQRVQYTQLLIKENVGNRSYGSFTGNFDAYAIALINEIAKYVSTSKLSEDQSFLSDYDINTANFKKYMQSFSSIENQAKLKQGGRDNGIYKTIYNNIIKLDRDPNHEWQIGHPFHRKSPEQIQIFYNVLTERTFEIIKEYREEKVINDFVSGLTNQEKIWAHFISTSLYGADTGYFRLAGMNINDIANIRRDVGIIMQAFNSTGYNFVVNIVDGYYANSGLDRVSFQNFKIKINNLLNAINNIRNGSRGMSGLPNDYYTPTRNMSGLPNDYYTPVIASAIVSKDFMSVKLNESAQAYNSTLYNPEKEETINSEKSLGKDRLEKLNQTIEALEDDDKNDLKDATVLFIDNLDNKLSEYFKSTGLEVPVNCYGSHYGIARKQYYFDVKLLDGPVDNIAEFLKHLRHEVKERRAVMEGLNDNEKIAIQKVVNGQFEARSQDLNNKIARLATEEHDRLLIEERLGISDMLRFLDNNKNKREELVSMMADKIQSSDAIREVYREIERVASVSKKADLMMALRTAVAIPGVDGITPNKKNVIVQSSPFDMMNAAISADKGISRKLAGEKYNNIYAQSIVDDIKDEDGVRRAIEKALNAIGADADARILLLFPKDLQDITNKILKGKNDNRILAQYIDQGERPDTVTQFILGLEILQYARDTEGKNQEDITQMAISQRFLNLMSIMVEGALENPVEFIRKLFKEVLVIRKINWQDVDSQRKSWEAVAKSL